MLSIQSEEIPEEYQSNVAILSTSDAVEVPFELVEEILGWVVLSSSEHDRKMDFLTLSKTIYTRLFPIVYRVIELPIIKSGQFRSMDEIGFSPFFSWINSMNPRSLLLHIKALYLRLDTSGTESERWTTLFKSLCALEILDFYCGRWEGGCSEVVWDSILHHRSLKHISFDWHFNGLKVPAAPDDTLSALRTVTHIVVVPDEENSWSLAFFGRFLALTHLAVINPKVGYTREQLLSFEAGLPNLHILVVSLIDEWEWPFEETKKIVIVRECPDEILDEDCFLWTKGEELLTRRHRSRSSVSQSSVDKENQDSA
ncbi:hypothetical protein DL96DRAFT_1716391 [Flagelloscypha sp. PMI_526]|nr:hypothetical protein DL96DRAFT_1716391 [Flagelloscypha sp. PMI_526]